MNISEEQFRNSLHSEPSCMTEALNDVTTSDNVEAAPAAELTRALCFELTQLDNGNTAPALGAQVPFMVEHGLRQVALASTVLTDAHIQDRLPSWFDRKLFTQALLVADTGLAHINPAEVSRVHELGPKYANTYDRHPQYGYEASRNASDRTDERSQILGLLIARHHAIQARNSYGPGWNNLPNDIIDPDKVDLMIALQKPFDYFDDYFGRVGTQETTFRDQAEAPRAKFLRSYGELLVANETFAGAIVAKGFDPSLPLRISDKILEVVLAEGDVGEMYRRLRPDLTAPGMSVQKSS